MKSLHSMLGTRTMQLNGGGFSPASLAGNAAWYIAGVGQTDAGGGACSAWVDQSGNGRNLTQGTATNQPAIQSDGSLLFDGADNYMQAGFTLAQPYTVYLAFLPVSFTNADQIYSGVAADTGVLLQSGVTPTLALFAGSAVTNSISGPAVGARGVITAVFNGASSITQFNGGADVTGNPGATAPDGITLGCNFNASGAFSNIQAWELLIRSGMDNAATRLQIQQYLANKYGT